MRILLLGKNGQVGWELRRTLAPLGLVAAYDAPEIDLAEPIGLERNLKDLVESMQPQVIVNATAYTAVDRAETEPKKAIAVNAAAPARLAELAHTAGAALIHYSTDYVFDGKKGSDYVETDPPNPLNVYGNSKLTGEKAIQEIDGASLILRTSWVYSLRRSSFISKVLEWSRRNPDLRLVSDQVGSPTWARMLAEVTAQILAASSRHPVGWIYEHRGLYHLAGDGSASRYEWGRAILHLDPHPEEQVVHELLEARTADFPRRGRAPAPFGAGLRKFQTNLRPEVCPIGRPACSGRWRETVDGKNEETLEPQPSPQSGDICC